MIPNLSLLELDGLASVLTRWADLIGKAEPQFASLRETAREKQGKRKHRKEETT